MMNMIPGGATVKPFVTCHTAYKPAENPKKLCGLSIARAINGSKVLSCVYALHKELPKLHMIGQQDDDG